METDYMEKLLKKVAELISEPIKKSILKELKKIQTPEETNENDLLTAKEACELLQIHKSTLWQWTKKGKIKIYGIGGRRYYKRSQIINDLILLNKKGNGK